MRGMTERRGLGGSPKAAPLLTPPKLGYTPPMSLWKAKQPGRPDGSVTLRVPSARTGASLTFRHGRRIASATNEKPAAAAQNSAILPP